MNTNKTIQSSFDPDTFTHRYSSVEIAIGNAEPAYMFRIRNIPSSGVGILVKEGSAVLKHLKVGDELNLKYNPLEATDLPEYIKTEIRYITKYDQICPHRHYWVNFAVLEE